mmetsp:Transcript_62399/g.184632  ORF Transcript_62399/g.184632 Transcript_62399/m.184632 type:complete len:462 (+) Transcript_62399:152-1537(+)
MQTHDRFSREMGRNTLCEVLFWPNHSVWEGKKSFIVGWEDTQGSGSKGLRDKRGDGARILICAFLIEAVTSRSEEGSGVSRDDLQQSLSLLSEHRTCLKNGRCQSKNGLGCCWACSKYRALKILGIWDPHLSGENVSIGLPQFTTASHCQQLVLYQSCGGIHSLKHYCHKEKRAAGFAHLGAFQVALARISEAECVEEELKLILRSDDALLYSSHLGPKVTMRDDLKSGDSEILTRSCRLRKFCSAWSLSFLHWNGHCSRRMSSNGASPIFFSHVPLIYALYLFRNMGKHGPSSGKIVSPRTVHARSSLKKVYSAVLAAFDGTIGFAVGLTVALNADRVHSACVALWDLLHRRLLRDNIGWLETFPVGFKLNVPLTRNMGRGELNNVMCVGVSSVVSHEVLSYLFSHRGFSTFPTGQKFWSLWRCTSGVPLLFSALLLARKQLLLFSALWAWCLASLCSRL